MDILDDLKIMADSFDDEGDLEMSAVFVRCIAEIRKLRAALEPMAGVDLCGIGLPENFGLHVLRARDALKTPNDRVEGCDAALSRRVPSHDGLEGWLIRRRP